MCFYTNILKYITCIPKKKFEKGTKKTKQNKNLQLGPKSAPVQHEKETASEILRTPQSISWT